MEVLCTDLQPPQASPLRPLVRIDAVHLVRNPVGNARVVAKCVKEGRIEVVPLFIRMLHEVVRKGVCGRAYLTTGPRGREDGL